MDNALKFKNQVSNNGLIKKGHYTSVDNLTGLIQCHKGKTRDFTTSCYEHSYCSVAALKKDNLSVKPKIGKSSILKVALYNSLREYDLFYKWLYKYFKVTCLKVGWLKPKSTKNPIWAKAISAEISPKLVLVIIQ